METRTRKDMLAIYGIGCPKTLKRHLDKHEIVLDKHTRLTAHQQLSIFKALGIPANLPAAELDWVKAQLKEQENKKLPPPQIYDNLEVFYPLVFSIFSDKKEPYPIMPENTRLGHLTN